MHISAVNGDYRKLLPQVAPFCTRKITQDAKTGLFALNVESKADILKIKDNKGKLLTVSNFMNQNIAIQGGKKYVFSCNVKGKLANMPGNYLLCFVRFSNAKKQNVPCRFSDWRVDLAPAWKLHKTTFSAPTGATKMNLRLALYGVGNYVIDDISVTPAK